MLTLPPHLAPPYRFVPATTACLLAGIVTFLPPPRAAQATPAGPPGKAVLAAATATATSLADAQRTASAPRILYGGVPLPESSSDLAPYRDPADNQVCIAPESLAPLGVMYIADTAMGKVSLVGPDGATNTTVPLRRRPGTENQPDAPAFVPAKQVIEALGGKWEENATTNVCTAFSVLTDVQMIGGQLRVKATFPVLPKIRTDRDHPGLILMDIPGADIGALPHSLNLQSPNVATARCGQFSDDTARIVLQLKDASSGPAPGGFAVLGEKPATQIVMNPLPPAPIAIAAAAPAAATPSGTGTTATRRNTPAAPIVISNNNASHTVVAKQGGSGKTTAKSSKPVAPPTVIRSVAFRGVSDQQAQIIVQAGRIPDIRTDMSKGRLTLDMTNATLASASVADSLTSAKHPFLRSAQILPRGSVAAQLVLDLTRAVNYTVRMIPGGGFILDLMMPRSAGGRLKGKLIVIDPGHGGHDSGARGINGTREKDVNLSIASKLADTLRNMGANVIMTRSTDDFIPVDDRPVIANHAGADFFISVHADSGDFNHSVNGSTIYYHMQVPSCKSLAQCIADRMSDMGGIHSKGPHSDGLQYGGRFVNGYGVLRGSQMVAVLCECGYMSNAGDAARLNDPAQQQKIAESIANGLKDYVEGNPDFDTRNINPQAEGTLTPLGPAPNATSGDGNSKPNPGVDPTVTPVGNPNGGAAGGTSAGTDSPGDNGNGSNSSGGSDNNGDSAGS